MRRLREHQTVELDLESENYAITCRVASVTGTVATLIPDGRTPQSVELNTGAPGYLVFQDRGNLIALRGIAATAAGNQAEVEFVVIDGVVLPAPRGRPGPIDDPRPSGPANTNSIKAPSRRRSPPASSSAED